MTAASNMYTQPQPDNAAPAPAYAAGRPAASTPDPATRFSASFNPPHTAQYTADDSTITWQHEALTKIQEYRALRSVVVNFVNLSTVVLFISCTVYKLASDTANFSVTLINVYACVLGLSLLVIELKEIDQAIEYFLFLFTVKGRGLLYVFLGCLIIDTQLFPLFTGMWLLAIGMAMFLGSFTRRVPYLTNLKDNWRVWSEVRVRRRRAGEMGRGGGGDGGAGFGGSAGSESAATSMRADQYRM